MVDRVTNSIVPHLTYAMNDEYLSTEVNELIKYFTEMHFTRQTTLKDFQNLLFNMTQIILDNEKDIRFANLEDYYKTGIESAKLSNIEENVQFYKELRKKLLAIESPRFDKECIDILFKDLDPIALPNQDLGSSMGSPDSGSLAPSSMPGSAKLEPSNPDSLLVPSDEIKTEKSKFRRPSHVNIDQLERKQSASIPQEKPEDSLH